MDSLVKELGYAPLEMGLGMNEFAWMNEAIFDSLHHSSVVLVDLTGLRPNCFVELGYGLGNEPKLIITARDDTQISFDAFALEAFRWKESEDVAPRLERFRTHWKRNINMPALIRKGGEMKQELYFSVDIESSGPIPGKYACYRSALASWGIRISHFTLNSNRFHLILSRCTKNRQL